MQKIGAALQPQIGFPTQLGVFRRHYRKRRPRQGRFGSDKAADALDDLPGIGQGLIIRFGKWVAMPIGVIAAGHLGGKANKDRHLLGMNH